MFFFNLLKLKFFYLIFFNHSSIRTQDKQHELIRQLGVNLSNEPFKDLSLNSRIQLIKTLCDQVLSGNVFLRECERLEHAENECRQTIKLLKSKLTHLVGTSNPEKCSSRKLKPE